MAIFTLETDYPSETGNSLEIHVRQKISLNLKMERAFNLDEHAV